MTGNAGHRETFILPPSCTRYHRGREGQDGRGSAYRRRSVFAPRCTHAEISGLQHLGIPAAHAHGEELLLRRRPTKKRHVLDGSRFWETRKSRVADGCAHRPETKLRTRTVLGGKLFVFGGERAIWPNQFAIAELCSLRGCTCTYGRWAYTRSVSCHGTARPSKKSRQHFNVKQVDRSALAPDTRARLYCCATPEDQRAAFAAAECFDPVMALALESSNLQELRQTNVLVGSSYGNSRLDPVQP